MSVLSWNIHVDSFFMHASLIVAKTLIYNEFSWIFDEKKSISNNLIYMTKIEKRKCILYIYYTKVVAGIFYASEFFQESIQKPPFAACIATNVSWN